MLEALLKSMGLTKYHINAMAAGLKEARQDTKDIKELLQKIHEEQQLTNRLLEEAI